MNRTLRYYSISLFIYYATAYLNYHSDDDDDDDDDEV